MKKLILLMLICIPLLTLLSGCSFGDGMMPMVLEKNGNVLTIFVIFGETESIELYDITLSAECPMDRINSGDLIAIELQVTDQLTSGDNVSGVLPLSNLDQTASTPEIDDAAYASCVVSNVAKYPGTYNLLSADYLKDSQYIIGAMDEVSYLMTSSNNCILDQIGQSGLLISKQSAETFRNGDQITYGVSIDDSFKVSKPISCYLGTLTLVYDNDAYLQSVNQSAGTLRVIDKTQYLTYDVKVDSSCELLTKDLEEDGTLIYSDPNNTQPLYVQFNEHDEMNLGIDFDINTITCGVKQMTLVEENPVPTLYYIKPLKAYLQSELDLDQYELIGKFQKQVYSSRPAPNTLVGYMIKGQTDPATYTVDQDGKLHWMRNEQVAQRLYGDDWDSQIIWFSDAIIYTYQFGETINE